MFILTKLLQTFTCEKKVKPRRTDKNLEVTYFKANSYKVVINLTITDNYNNFSFCFQGSHVPKVPEYVLRAQEYIASHPAYVQAKKI